MGLMPGCKHCSLLVIGPPNFFIFLFFKSSENDFRCPTPAGCSNFQLRSQWLEVEFPKGMCVCMWGGVSDVEPRLKASTFKVTQISEEMGVRRGDEEEMRRRQV